MNIHLPGRMTGDQFLRWSVAQDGGRSELEQGRVIPMQSQNLAHVVTKQRVYSALAAAIGRSGVPCYALPDGPSVRIGTDRCYEPDALVAPLPMPPANSLEVTDPVLVVEVLSPTPSSMRRDLQTKLMGYALVPSIAHYVVVDPHERTVFRFHREGAGLVAAEELTEGTLRLDPPGIEMPVEDLLPPAASAT